MGTEGTRGWLAEQAKCGAGRLYAQMHVESDLSKDLGIACRVVIIGARGAKVKVPSA